MLHLLGTSETPQSAVHCADVMGGAGVDSILLRNECCAYWCNL